MVTDRDVDATGILAGATIEVAGLAVRLGADDAERADAVAALFRHARRTGGPPAVEVCFRRAPIGRPPEPPDTTLDGIELWRSEAGRLVVHCDEGLSACATADRLVVGGEASSLARVFRYVAFMGLSHLLGHRGFSLLHAGALVADGRAVLVLGDTGSGKSTLALTAVRAGWPVLADDLVAVRPAGGGTLVAAGFPRPISVPADVLGDGEAAGGRLVPEDPRGRTELPPETMATTVHPVAGVVVTGRSDGPATLEPVDGHEALRLVFRSCVSVADPALVSQVFAAAGALARLPTWRLGHASDPTVRVEAAGRLLERVRAAIAEEVASDGRR